MKLRLMQRKLIINKITGVTAITDNNCVKETTSEMCVCVCVREALCVISRTDRPPYLQGTGLPRTKEQTRQRIYYPF